MMERQQLIETLKTNIKSARRRDLDWLPIPLATAEAILRALFTLSWIVETETSIISHKCGVSMAAYIADGKPDARFLILKEVSDMELMTALNGALDDVKAATDALVEEAMGVVEGRWAR